MLEEVVHVLTLAGLFSRMQIEPVGADRIWMGGLEGDETRYVVGMVVRVALLKKLGKRSLAGFELYSWVFTLER